MLMYFRKSIVVLAAVAVLGQVCQVQSASKKSSTLQELKPESWWVNSKYSPVIHLVVDKTLQSVAVYSDGRLLSRSNVSTGKEGHETPGGIFSILSKNRYHHSNIYSRAPMPFMQRLTWSGIALHESKSVPDYPASHGCVRLPGGFAAKLFKFTDNGAQVIITNRSVMPSKFSSPHLFQIGNSSAIQVSSLRPTMAAISGVTLTSTVKSEKPLRVLLTRNTGREQLVEIQSILNELRYDAGEADGWMGPQTGRAIRAFQTEYKHKISGALNDDLMGQLYRATGRGEPKNGHVYIRRNKKPLFDIAVRLTDEKVPLGTHLFTAVKPDNAQKLEPESPYWLAMSIEQTGWIGRDEDDLSSPSNAKAALARFDLPQFLKDKISGLINQGSTVAIADQGISKETISTGTDFIILTQ